MTVRWLSAVAIAITGALGLPGCSNGTDTNVVSDAGGGDASASCATGQTKCGTACVSTADDRANCGACGNACGAGLMCVAGKCSVACPATQKDCAGSCATLETDRDNCGACGVKCAAGQVCSAGKCELSCGYGLAECGTGDARTCANQSSDRENCGTCGNACAAGELCVGGKCETTCGGDLKDCSGTCRDTKNDPNNCGACGTVCPAGQVCSAGACSSSCGSGLTACSGVCKDLNYDSTNCGACTSACATGEVCSAGRCSVSCASGLKQCGGVCRDVRFDKSHCGACGNACAPGQVCNDGVCETNCGTLSNCSGTCKDTRVDVSNCGTCGNACTDGKVCAAGVCTSSCGSLTACSGLCKDTKVDSTNCGACGISCGDGQRCVGGVCTLTCPTGLTKCGTACVNLTIDGSNCGACGTPCASGKSCSGGTCITAGTGGGCGSLTDCGGGSCKDTRLDPANCGTCGNACTGGKVCSSGTCACAPGRISCGSSCVDPTSSSLNCGACGAACPSGQVCRAGVCGATVAGNGGAGGSLTGSTLPKIAVLGAASSGSTDLSSKLSGLGEFSSVEYINISSSSTVPNLAKLKTYDAVSVYTYLGPSNGATFGNDLASYLEAGGGVVIFDYETMETGSFGMTGRYVTDYALTTLTSSSSMVESTFSLGSVLDPSHPIMAGVTTLSCSGADCTRLPTSSIKTSATVVANWNDGVPAVLTSVINGHRVVELNMFGASSDATTIGSYGWDSGTNGTRIIANAYKWSIPPLTVKTSTTLDVGTTAVGTPKTMSLVYTNASSAPQTITGFTLSGGHIADFAVTPAGTLPATVAPGATYTVTITFQPSDAGLRAVTVSAAVAGVTGGVTTLLTGTGS